MDAWPTTTRAAGVGARMQVFWDPRCLEYTWHDTDPEHGCHTIKPVKTFREKSGYPALLLSFSRTMLFNAIFFQAVNAMGAVAAESGATDVGNVDYSKTLVSMLVASTSCAITWGWAHLVVVVLAAIHGTPPINSESIFSCSLLSFALRPMHIAKLVYSAAWAGALHAIGNGASLLGVDTFGTPLWFALIGARLLIVMFAEGVLPIVSVQPAFAHALVSWEQRRRTAAYARRLNTATPPFPGRLAWLAKLQNLLLQLERGHTHLPTWTHTFIGYRHMRQPLKRKAVYVGELRHSLHRECACRRRGARSATFVPSGHA